MLNGDNDGKRHETTTKRQMTNIRHKATTKKYKMATETQDNLQEMYSSETEMQKVFTKPLKRDSKY